MRLLFDEYTIFLGVKSRETRFKIWYILKQKGYDVLGYLIVISIASIVLQNGLFNSMTKKEPTDADGINRFYVWVYAVCLAALGVLLFTETVSFYTVGMGLLFGVVTALSNFYKMQALAFGPMHLTLLFTTSSMILPTLSGVFFGEGFRPVKLLVVGILLGFLYLSFDKQGETKVGGRWFLSCLLAFVFQGGIGILQKIHQSSVHKDETIGFLFVAFACAEIFCLCKIKGGLQSLKIGGKTVIIGLICGACIFAMNVINLKLSGLLPSQLFFPLINGSAMIASSVMSVVIFKETLSKKQLIGLIGGIGSLIAICLVP